MIMMSEYAKRRKALMKTIGPGSVAIVSSADDKVRNGDAHFPFRQNSDFYYLTGFNEPDAVLVLLPKHKDGEYILFNRIRDRDREIWDGPRLGQQGAVKELLADQAFPIGDFESKLPELLADRESIHYPIGINQWLDKKLIAIVNNLRAKIRSGIQVPTNFVDISHTLAEMRLFKSPAEIALMRKAIDITHDAHLRAMEICQPGMYEYELEAELLYTFCRKGSRHAAYNSIVGSGRNSCILHYMNNDKIMENGDLVLIDAGAEFQNYAADITRTFPVNGKFSPEQRSIYDIVLNAQLAAINTIKKGASWLAAQLAITKVITQGLIDLGILKGHRDDLIETQAYLPFYMHRSGHWLGLDVHDVGAYKVGNKWRPLEAGMVLTVEPGIYISDTLPGINKRWHHIGIRIEDDVLVTETGCEVLSKSLPKKAEEIEAIMRK